MTLNDENWGGWVRLIDFTLREKEKIFYAKYLFKIAKVTEEVKIAYYKNLERVV